jgi:TnpA family transposase
MPVEFLTDEEAAVFGRYAGPPARAELDRMFYLDDADMRLVAKRRGDHMRLGFALQLTTVRYLGTFLTDPLDVPPLVTEHLAGQLRIGDPGCAARYAERRTTPLEHRDEIKAEGGLREFAEAEGEFAAWVHARAWNTGDGPKTIFADGVKWLRENAVLLPGVTTAARLVSRVRDEALDELYATLAGLPGPYLAARLEGLVTVPDGARYSELELWRRGPSKPTGRSLERGLTRVAEVSGTGIGRLDLEAHVPRRRVVDLARHGMAARAQALRRLGDERRLATLVATVAYLEGRTVDDCLELLDLLMTSDLLSRAEKAAGDEQKRRHPSLVRHSARLAAAVEVLFDVTDSGGELTLDQVWEAVEAVVPRGELREAVDAVAGMVPPPGSDADAEMRAHLTERIATVTPFLKLLTEVITFGAAPEGGQALAAMKALPRLLDRRTRITAADIDLGLLAGSWRALVMPKDGGADRSAWVFCVLTAFHRHLRRREIYAEASTRWRDPRAQLLAGDKLDRAKVTVMADLQLGEDPGALLAEQSRALDDALRDVAAQVSAGTIDTTVDDQGRLHLPKLSAIPDPPSLTDLRKRVAAMLPRVDLPEVILEVMSWIPGFTAAFTPASGGRSRLDDLHVSVAACLTAQALNIGYAPVAKRGAPALEPARLAHVAGSYLSAEAFSRANAPLIEAQAGIPFAQALGGGLVAAIDGMRFVVPVPSIYARPNRKYFGPRRGVTWLNMINDQAAGLGGRVVQGTIRDSLHMIDVWFSQDGGQRPDIIVTDTGSYSDLIFGLVSLLGGEYRPALADIPDQKGWRISPSADYGPLSTFARGRIDLGRIRANWSDILRVVVSIYTGEVRAYDVVRMLQRDGHPTALGEAIAMYGRIPKTLHICSLAAEEAYRRDIKGMRNLQEGRHALAGKTFHGKKGELYQRYHEGMEDQLGALGLILNCIVLWNTRYMNAALDQLRAQGYLVLGEDVARLSPFARDHLNVAGNYTFSLPDLGEAGFRPLRDPDAQDDEMPD